MKIYFRYHGILWSCLKGWHKTKVCITPCGPLDTNMGKNENLDRIFVRMKILAIELHWRILNHRFAFAVKWKKSWNSFTSYKWKIIYVVISGLKTLVLQLRQLMGFGFTIKELKDRHIAIAPFMAWKIFTASSVNIHTSASGYHVSISQIRISFSKRIGWNESPH